MREGWMADRLYSGVTGIVWVRISNAEHRIEHSACPLLRFKANIAAACACSGVSPT